MIYLIAVYLFAWWAVFWLPLKKDNMLRFLAFMPATVLAILPFQLVDIDIVHDHITLIMTTWFILPFPIIAFEIYLKRKNKSRTSGWTLR